MKHYKARKHGYEHGYNTATQEISKNYNMKRPVRHRYNTDTT